MTVYYSLNNSVQGYIMHLFRELIDRQVWTDDGSASERMLRSYLLLFACLRCHPPCVSTATKRFNEWKESNGNMRSDISSYNVILISFSL